MSLAYVTGGNGECVGFIIGRGKIGFEGIIGDEHSLGMFPSEPAAAKAILNWNENDRNSTQGR
jgi:hypothetical protein